MPHAESAPSPHWRLLPWVALALLLAAQLWLLPYPRAYAAFDPERLGALGFVALVTLFSFLVRSRSVKLAAVLLTALLFVRFAQLHAHLALLHALQAVAPEACRGLEPSPGSGEEATRRALARLGKAAEAPPPFFISCDAGRAEVRRGPAYLGDLAQTRAFDEQGNLVGL